jgi:hypothetical protein
MMPIVFWASFPPCARVCFSSFPKSEYIIVRFDDPRTTAVQLDQERK